MNRYKFTTPKVIPKCGQCKGEIGRYDRAYRGTGDAWLCQNCFKKALTGIKSSPIITTPIAEIWERKKNASLIYPQRIFFDGRNILDMETKEYLRMKAWDIIKYYSRVTNAEEVKSSDGG